MKPALSAPHGTGLTTTSGITAVISLVIAVSLLGQCNHLGRTELALAVCGFVALIAGAGALYGARNHVGQALDSAASDPGSSAVDAARALARFHAGIAAVFAGCGFAAAFRLPITESPAVLIAPAVAFAFAISSLVRAVMWLSEVARRKAVHREATIPVPEPRPRREVAAAEHPVRL